MDKWILIGQTAVPEPDLLKWAEWMQSADNGIVKQEQIGDYLVSTVFLGFDHAHFGGPPLLFETMVFSDGGSCYCRCCSTWMEAERQHEDACRQARAGAFTPSF